MKNFYSQILLLTALICLFISSCENSVDTQNQSISLKKEPNLQKQKDHLNEGLKFKVAGEYEKAIEEFKKSIEAGNDDKEMYRRIADLYHSLKKYEETETYLRKILEKDSKDVRAHWFLAGLLVWDLGKYEEGLKQAVFAKELDSSNESYVMEQTIGKAYEGLGDYENAIKHYKIYLKAISFIPDSDSYKNTKRKIEELEAITKN
jgi:tetratricopeptide (TPR) repeat protein